MKIKLAANYSKLIFLIIFLFPFIFYGQTLLPPVNHCKDLKEKNENYGSGDNGFSYCNIKSSTTYSRCMCEYEDNLKAYKEETDRIKKEYVKLNQEFVQLYSKADSKLGEGLYIYTGIEDSESFEDDKVDASILFSEAEAAIEEARRLAYRLGVLCPKVYVNCTDNLSKVSKTNDAIREAIYDLSIVERKKQIKIKLSNSGSKKNNNKDKAQEQEKEEEEEQEEEKKTYDQLRAEYTYKAGSLYKQLQNNKMSLSQRKKIVDELKVYEEYLTPKQKETLQTQKTENALADTFVALSNIKINEERVSRKNLKVKYKNNSFNSYQFGFEFANAWKLFFLSVYINGVYSSINGWEYNEDLDLEDLKSGDLIYTTGDGDDEFFKRNENIQSFGGGLELSMGVRIDLSNKTAITPYGIGELAIGTKSYSSIGFGGGLQFEIGRFTFGAEYMSSTYNFRVLGGSINESLPPDVIPLTNLNFKNNDVIEREWLNSTTNNDITIYRSNYDKEEKFEYTKPKLGYFTFSLAFSL